MWEYDDKSSGGGTILIQGRAATPRLGSMHPTETGSKCGYREEDQGATAVDLWIICSETSFLLQKRFPVGSPAAMTSKEFMEKMDTENTVGDLDRWNEFASLRYGYTDQGDWWVVDAKRNKSEARRKVLRIVTICEADKWTAYTYIEIRAVGSNDIYTLREVSVHTAKAGKPAKE